MLNLLLATLAATIFRAGLSKDEVLGVSVFVFRGGMNRVDVLASLARRSLAGARSGRSQVRDAATYGVRMAGDRMLNERALGDASTLGDFSGNRSMSTTEDASALGMPGCWPGAPP
mmetsp:Transcript_34803/g.68715  ORF Transcript_34803/g.68715 Transcript_34803/m.68715 type:complete len:116 (+) Transcript_34803:281-628(+)